MDRVILEFIKGSKQGTKITLYNGFRIGRDPECEIFIDDEAISKKHSVFEIVGNQVIIKDLNSSNGTFVNGKKIPKAVLKNDDDISFGRSMARISFEGEQAGSNVEKTSVDGKKDTSEKKDIKASQEKKSNLKKVLLFAVAGFLILMIGGALIKGFLNKMKRKEPVVLSFNDFHDIKNRYVTKYPKTWKKSTFATSYFRDTGAFDYILVKFKGLVDGYPVTFAVDRLEGFSFDKELETLVDFSAEKYPRFLAVPRQVISKGKVNISGLPGILVESAYKDKKTSITNHVFEIYLLQKDYLNIKSDSNVYSVPHNTRYIIIFVVPEWIYPRIQLALKELINGFEFNKQTLPSKAIENVTRSKLLEIYQEKVKRAEYLLERTNIDVGNLFRALNHYKSAMWITIEYEDLGGSSKYRKDLVKKTVLLNKELAKKYDTYQFNIKKGNKLMDRQLIVESAEKIMELYPDVDNYKHLRAKRVLNKFKKR